MALIRKWNVCPSFYLLVVGFVANCSSAVFAQQDDLLTLMHTPVQDELVLEAVQKEQVLSLLKERRNEWRTGYQEMVVSRFDEVRGERGAEIAQSLEEFSLILADKYYRTLKSILNEQQLRRLREVTIQRAGARPAALILRNREIADLLKITGNQRAQLIQLKNEAVVVGLSPDTDPMTLDSLKKKHERRIQEILTEEQQQTLQRAKGEPFDVSLLKSANKPSGRRTDNRSKTNPDGGSVD